MKLCRISFNVFYRSLVAMLLLLSAASSMAATLTASVDRDVLGLDETFTLVLRYDRQINAAPDYELLSKDFDILNTQSGTQMSIINGNMEATTEWKIALAPKRIGTLLIPSFNIDGAVSDAIPITVEGKSRSPQNTDSEVSVELETDKDSAFVQEQIIVTLRLYTTVGLSGIDLQPLQIKDALILQLDEKQYQTRISGRPGAVVETRYAVFPQQSGEMLIPSVLYQVSLDAGQRDLWDRFYGNSQNNIRRLRTEEQRVTINPAPASANATSWLPAKEVQLEEHWSASPDSVKLGEPITRTITIKAEGLSAGQIAPLDLPAVNGLTFYKDQAQTDDQKSTQGIVGSRIETLAIVSTQAGQFTLPEVSISWWDTEQKIMQRATLPEVTLKVSSGAMSPNNLTPAPTLQEETDPAGVPLNTDLNSINTDNAAPVASKTPLWLYLTNLFTLIALVYLALRYWQLQQRVKRQEQEQQQQHTQKMANEQAAWAEVKRSLSENNLAQLRKALLQWAQLHWPGNHITSLQALAQQANTHELTELLQQLDKIIFSGKNTHSGNDAELNNSSELDIQALLQLLANLRRRKIKPLGDGEILQPLYKTL